MIGDKIKKVRELKNYTQEYMAEQLDISQAAYSKLEHGTIKVSSEKLAEIARILGVSPEDIATFDSQKYFNSFNLNNVEGSNNGSIIIGTSEAELIKKLYEDKILLLEKLLNKTEKDLIRYRDRFGEL